MKYISTNRMQDFEFHDTDFTFVSWKNNRLTVSAKYLNVHKNAAPNNSGADMEIAEAQITFSNPKIIEFEPCRAWKTDENGNSYTDDPYIVYTGDEARDMFVKELCNTINIKDFDPREGAYLIFAVGKKSCFIVRFNFSHINIAWDDYRKKAWYELHKQYNKQLTLATENGDIKVDALITCNDEDVYSSDENGKAPSVFILIKYGGKEFRGQGRDSFCTDAFASLQKNLPDGVKIKSCMTCRHGNFCPVGNCFGELFCTKDVTIREKSDLFFYTEDYTERDNRSRGYTDICEDYKEQTADHFTYSDYLYHLGKKMI